MRMSLKSYKRILCGAAAEVHGFRHANPAKHQLSNLWRTNSCFTWFTFQWKITPTGQNFSL